MAHEHWESVWLNCHGPEKTFLQGLIQMACAFHHMQRNNHRGATSLLKAALQKLEPCAEVFQDIHVASLRDEIRPWLQALETPNLPSQPPIPAIHVASQERD